jgi:hypothetical protein
VKSRILKLTAGIRGTLLTILFMYASLFPKSGLIKDCSEDYDYDSNDDIQMFI